MLGTGKVVIAQGGGPTPVVNASLFGVVREATRQLGHGTSIWGAQNGITGVLQERWIDLRNVKEQLWKQIAESPGAALGSCRKSLNPEEAVRAVSILRDNDVRYFFYIGGNDSMDTALKINQAALDLHHEMVCCGIPKTIDNDLPGTDHCPGFGSAARYMAQSTADLGADVRSLPTPVSILEVMGRDAGWLTAATLLARKNPGDAPHLIYVPEVPLTREKFLSDVQQVYDTHGWVVAAVAEGVKNKEGKRWGDRQDDRTADDFGHRLPGNVAATLANLVTSELGLRARGDKPGLLARSSAIMASPVDRLEAEEIGAFGFSRALKGNTGFMASIVRQQTKTYVVEYGSVPLENVANKVRLLPLGFVTDHRNDIRAEFRAYAEPLVGALVQHACLTDRGFNSANPATQGR